MTAPRPTASRDGWFRPRRIGHANLYISDYHRSLGFYRDVAGLGGGWLRPGIGGAFLNNGATHHDIGFIPWNSTITRSPATGPGLNHLGFELENETEMMDSYRAALAGGVKFHATVDHLVARSVYSFDPHGFGTEIYVDTEISYKQPDFLTLKRASAVWEPGMTPPSPVPHYVKEPHPMKYELALFHAQRISGVVLVTDRFEAAWDYYTGLVGLRPLVGTQESAVACLGGTCGGHDVTLIRAGEGRTPGFHHLHFPVFDEADLENSLARAAAAGIAIERRIDHPLRVGAFVRDPDGMGVLFYVDRRPGDTSLAQMSPDEALWLA